MSVRATSQGSTRASAGQQGRQHELGLNACWIEIVKIDLHDERVGARIEPLDDIGQGMVLLAQIVNGAEQPELRVLTGRNAPDGRIGPRIRSQ
jgi:hypothetical protein